MKSHFTIQSPAKINLFLRVTSRRPDGYHELISLFCALDLHDRLSFKKTPGSLKFSCDSPRLPTDASNLAHRAALLFYQRTGLPQGMTIHLEKRTPVGAGLGGGSSNAATVLKTLNHIYQYPVSKADMAALALSIGADVPFFLSPQPAIATGIGDILAPFPGLAPYVALIIYPKIEVSTKWVYQNLDLGLTNCKKTLKYTLLKQEGFRPDRHLCNDLETVTAKRYPQIAEIKQQLVENKALGALMSGSGSAVFGLFKTLAQAEETKRILDKRLAYDSFVTTLKV